MPYRTGGYQGDYTGGYQGDPQLGGLLTLGARLAGRGIRGLLGRISGRSLVRAGAATTAVAAIPVAGRIGREKHSHRYRCQVELRLDLERFCPEVRHL